MVILPFKKKGGGRTIIILPADEARLALERMFEVSV
jgi:hypothetical protein